MRHPGPAAPRQPGQVLGHRARHWLPGCHRRPQPATTHPGAPGPAQRTAIAQSHNHPSGRGLRDGQPAKVTAATPATTPTGAKQADHGSAAGGGRHARSESLAPGSRYVVMGPTTTKECREVSYHDKRGPRARVPAGASNPGVTAAPAHRPEAPDDHGGSAGGAWQNKSETAAAAPPFMILKSSQVIQLKSLHDQGSAAGVTAISP